jgi:hypothetical protein
VSMLDRYRHVSARPGSMWGSASDSVYHHGTVCRLRLAGSVLRLAGSVLRLAGSVLPMLGGGEGSRSATLVRGWRRVIVAGGDGR